MPRTIKLYTSDGRALTSIESADPTILLPTEIHVRDDGSVVACHNDPGGDVEYPSLDALCEDYQIDPAAVTAEEV